MSYMEYLNAFWKANRIYAFSHSEMVIYFKLLDACNSFGWPKVFSLSNKILCAEVSIAERTFVTARKRLKECKLIDYSVNTNTKKITQYTLNGLTNVYNSSDKCTDIIRIRKEEDKDKDKNIEEDKSSLSTVVDESELKKNNPDQEIFNEEKKENSKPNPQNSEVDSHSRPENFDYGAQGGAGGRLFEKNKPEFSRKIPEPGQRAKHKILGSTQNAVNQIISSYNEVYIRLPSAFSGTDNRRNPPQFLHSCYTKSEKDWWPIHRRYPRKLATYLITREASLSGARADGHFQQNSFVAF